MTIQTTRWSPDTCDCVLEYEWDSDIPQEDRVHTYKNIVSKCSEHSGLAHPETYEHVVKENQTKNLVINQVFDKLPRLRKDIKNDDGSVVTVLHPSVKYNWKFIGKDHQRQLHIDFQGANLTKEEKDILKGGVSALDKPVTIL